MELNNPILDIGREFLESGVRGVEITGIADMMDSYYRSQDMPIQVVEKRNKIYLLNKEWKGE